MTRYGSGIRAALMGVAAGFVATVIAVPLEAAADAPPAASRRERRRERSPVKSEDKPGDGEVVGGVGGRRRGAAASHAEKQTQQAALRGRVARMVTATPKGPCLREPVQFERGFGGDVQEVVLTRCDGIPALRAIDQLSVLVRPMNMPHPTPLATRIRQSVERITSPGIKRIHEGLVTRLQRVVDKFQVKKVILVSGYRPASLGSFHQSARALDFHVEGVRNEALVAFCRTLPDTGCGYYPNSSFVHLDVRPAGTGHVYWIDASGPGEPARYVSSWPPRSSEAAEGKNSRPGFGVPLDEHTHPDTGRRLPFGESDAKVDARTTTPWSIGGGGDDPFAP